MIKVNDVHFRYKKNQAEILKGISFTVEEGEIFGLLGPSGAGKSTLQKVLLGLNKGYSGSAQIMGTEAKQIGSRFYNKIGVGFELPNLYEQLTIEENLKTFQKLYENPADIPELLREVGLYEHRNKRVNELSKGMKMRLNFCRALIGNPSILFLDEPTSGLDPNNTKVIQDKIRKLKMEGVTVIVTTHNMTFADQICDRVAFVVDGTIKEIGKPEELRLQYGASRIRVKTKLEEREYPLAEIGQNMDFLTQIKNPVLHIDTICPTLEEIFTIVTGKILL
ncbi:ABC transporter ATP-binding protein [Anaerosporobacter faecicola]|uniref:ABC transporter ATP-binding protein n=1 Tax=Anaerosporobacter faecicola TaxID=2718714 RepID=UPI00143C830C|nr:ABC transporter ATP-binding protein [Anaerosporobacter faecicola]